MPPSEYIDYQKANKFDETKFPTNSSGMQSVKDLREIYKKETGTIFQSKIQVTV